MEFCPTCANMLLIGKSGGLLTCSTCAYVCAIQRGVVIERHLRLVKKAIEPILTEDDIAKRHTQETNQASCPDCGHNVAGYFEVQTRSADEPMTRFYQCRSCRSTWKEG